jgi:hypothetical protein
MECFHNLCLLVIFKMGGRGLVAGNFRMIEVNKLLHPGFTRETNKYAIGTI